MSAVEFLVGAAIVVGHNVFHVVPNEVPILFVLGLLSFRLREGSWAAMGFKRPASWARILLIALAAAALSIGPRRVRHRPAHRSLLAARAGSRHGRRDHGEHQGGPPGPVGLSRTFAAFGEEISYRGYLLGRAADLGKRSAAATWGAMVLASVLFGFGHYYKGPSGIVDSGVAGLILGAVPLLSGRNLWASILAHGLIDTVGIVALYFGWQS